MARPAVLLRSALACIACCALALLGGCGSLPPVGAEPPNANVAVPDGWQASDAAGAAAPAASDLQAWWQRFGDAGLAAWEQRALAGSPRVATAQALLQQAQAQRDAAAANGMPTLDGQAQAQRNTAGGLGRSGSAANSYQLGVQAGWAPDLFGAARAGLAAADATLQARRASLGDVQVQLAADVATAYVTLRTQQLRLALARQTLASQRETLQITDWRQQAGLVSLLELEQARTAVAQTEALLPALQSGVGQTRHALAVLAGLPPAAAPAADDEGDERATLPVPAEGLVLDIPAQTLRQRADLRAAEHEVAAALARVGQAQAQRWPSFAIGGTLGLNALTLGRLAQGNAVVSSLLASVSLPLFDGGALRAQVQSQQAALEQARQAHRSAVLSALQQVEDALLATQADRLRLASLRTAAGAAGNAALLARQRFSSGLVDFQTVLETQRSEFAARDALLSAGASLATSHVQLFKALGGGWRAAPPLALGSASP